MLTNFLGYLMLSGNQGYLYGDKISSEIGCSEILSLANKTGTLASFSVVFGFWADFWQISHSRLILSRVKNDFLCPIVDFGVSGSPFSGSIDLVRLFGL